MNIKSLEDIRKKLQCLEADQYPDPKNLTPDQVELRNAVFFKIIRISTDEKMDTAFALSCVFSAFRNINCRQAFIVDNSGGLSFYTGIIPLDSSLSKDSASMALKDAFTGVFRGSRLVEIPVAEISGKISARR